VIKPIPKHLLIHEIEHKEYLGGDNGDGWNGDEYGEAETIKHVRVEPGSQLRRDNHQVRIEGDYLVFLDAVHTKPLKELKEKDLVTFNCEQFEVKKVSPHYGFRKLHHYEVELG